MTSRVSTYMILKKSNKTPEYKEYRIERENDRNMIIFRKALRDDLDQIEAIYNKIHTEEEQGHCSIGWVRDIYPTRKTAIQALKEGDLFVADLNGVVLASARINKEQVNEYAYADWTWQAAEDEVMVLHTLTVNPKEKRMGIGSAFVAFYEDYAKNHGSSYLRMDTNERNVRARRLYRKLGYKEVGIVNLNFNGIPDVRLVCLEKKLIP